MDTAPIYLHSNRTSPGEGETIDILAAYGERLPPVLDISVSGTAAYTVQGSHDRVVWLTHFTGTDSQSLDLIVGKRYWRVPVTAVTGSVTASVGPIPDRNGKNILPRIVTPDIVPVP